MDPFSEHHLSDVLRSHLDKVLSEIKALDANYVSKASPAELESHFIDAAHVNPLVLRVDDKTIGSRDGVDIDVSHDFDRAVFPGERAFVRGTRLRIDIPFEGDTYLWRFRPSQFSLSGYPEIEISNGHISLTVTFTDDRADATALKRRIEEDIKKLVRVVDTISSDISTFNATVPARVRSALDDRMRVARSTTDALAGLGIPIKRSDTSPAYAIPAKRAPSPRSLPPVDTKPYEPEPFLRVEEYEHILGVLKSMGLVIERNPQSFITLNEEAIRTHFLLQLNGHYEGGATGETFNAEGKTDILIRIKDRNVFIAECKFWRGAKSFNEAISQLLGYMSWRDSKCALLIFNQTRDSSAVGDKMHTAMTAREECRKDLGVDTRGDHRYTFVKPSDPGREITITTMVFDVPRKGEA